MASNEVKSGQTYVKKSIYGRFLEGSLQEVLITNCS